MITNRSSDFEVTSTLQGPTIEMSFSAKAADLAKLMFVMENLYADPETAVLREYSNNARDATIEAGSDRPIEVTLPNRLEAVLKIRDWGVGLSHQDIEEIYSKYGASTKEETDEQTGHLGLGSKSAFAYCHMFTVSSVKNGIKIVMAVAKNDQGGGTITPVFSGTTDEPNGTCIEVPVEVSDIYDFERKAADLFRFWDEGTVLVNGSKPRPIGGIKITDNMLMTTEVDAHTIVMGGVPYSVKNSDLNLGTHYGDYIVVWVPMGSVDHQPDREGLRMTSLTRATLDAIIELYDESVVEAVQREIDAQTTHAEALEVLLNWRGKVPERLRPTEYTYKGAKIPLSFKRPAEPHAHFFRVKGDSSKLKDHDRVETYDASQWKRTWFVHGFDATAWTPHMRKKLNYFMESEKGRSWLGNDLFLISSERIFSHYIPSDRRIKWADINAVKLPRIVGARAGSDGRIPGSYDIMTGGTTQYGTPGDDIDIDLPLFFYRGKINDGDAINYYGIFSEDWPDCTIVALAANRIDKFRRIFPMARHCREGARELATNWRKTVTDEQIYAITVQNRNYRRDIEALDLARVDDPAFAEIAKVLKVDTTETRASMDKFSGYYQDVINYPETPANPFDAYPLLNGTLCDYRHYNRVVPRDLSNPITADHYYGYLNMAYKMRLDNSTSTD